MIFAMQSRPSRMERTSEDGRYGTTITATITAWFAFQNRPFILSFPGARRLLIQLDKLARSVSTSWTFYATVAFVRIQQVHRAPIFVCESFEQTTAGSTCRPIKTGSAFCCPSRWQQRKGIPVERRQRDFPRFPRT
jgi:hypothetical protein